MRRREFIARSSRAAVGCALVPAGAYVAREQRPAPATAGLVDRLTQQLPTWMREAHVPGAGIAVISNARIAWQGGFGVTDAASQTRVNNRTMFEAASMSKPAFAYVVMKLSETGVLDLDAPLTEYTSDRFLEGDARLEQITARHVLSHTTGFQNWRSNDAPLKIHFTPGERYGYSGEGYNYLQTVVTRLLGKPFESYMRERLFRPLGMDSSGYAWQPSMARPHDPLGKPLENKKSSPEAVVRYGAAGALLTTPSDFARFVIATIDPRRRDRFHLDPATVKAMLKPHVKLEGGRYPASWALGWQVFHNDARDFIYHGGNNEGFHCFAVASVAGKSGLVVMTNGDSGPAVLQQVLTDEATQSFLAR